MTLHPDPATLHDHVDGRLDAAAAEALERHLRDCAACARQVEAIRALLARAATAPRAVEPARDLWPGIRARLERTRVVPLRSGADVGARRGLSPLARRRLALLAAGLAIAVASSGITALLLDRRAERGAAPLAASGGAPPVATTPAPEPRPLDARALDAEYARAAAELAATWRSAEAPLAPATAATVDSSLRAVDAAIMELRRASAEAPDDPLLTELLAAAWRRKIDLLRRALALPASA